MIRDAQPGPAGPIESTTTDDAVPQPVCPPTQPEQALVDRRLLLAGAIGASSILTIRPAMAQAMTSVMNCSIPVPEPRVANQSIAFDGSLVPPGTNGAFAPPGRSFTAAEVKNGLMSGRLPGVNPDAAQAYLNYIRRLQTGQAGYSCYASLRFRR